MEFNPEIKGILKSCRINSDQGILCLLALYFNLEAEQVIPEEIFRKVSLTRIVEKDYTSNTVKWNIPLFVDQITGSFSWVGEWMQPFGMIGGRARLGNVGEVTKRMKKFFAKHPEYRKEDVFAARDLYFRTEKPSRQFVKTSYNFIFDGKGAMEVSALLSWCEQVRKNKDTSNVNPAMKGKIL